MKRLFLLIITALPLIFSSCFKCKDKPLNQVRVRIQNDLNVEIVRASLGSLMYKNPDSWGASCRMTDIFKNIPSGATTQYKDTYGNHLGYNRLRINRPGITSQVIPSVVLGELFEDELLRNGAVEDSVKNIYNETMEYGLSLPNGDYTFVLLSLFEDDRFIELEIRKD